MTTVVVVDDQPLIRSSLRALLDDAEGITVVGEAGDGEEAVRAVGRHRPDVVVMDVRMPRMDGLEATKVIRRDHPGTAVVVLTTYDVDEYVFRAVRAGASGFLLKDGDADELVRGVRAAGSGESVVAPQSLRVLLDEFARAPEPAPDAVALVDRLSAREREVLTLMAQGLSNDEISGRLHLSVATVKTHVGAVLAKTGSRDRTQAVVTAYRAGTVAPS